MHLLDLTLASPEQNLALDEALLDWADACPGTQCLRFWEAPRPFVVLGYSDRAATEVNQAACQECNCPILRRCSGGGTVLQGPGSLNYALVLPLEGELGSISQTNHFVLNRHRQALSASLQQPVELRGSTDLAIDGLKFSGNSQRRKRRALLFHGTLLHHLDWGLLDRLLPIPSRQPDYRQNRAHRDFLRPLTVEPGQLKRALQNVWNPADLWTALPLEVELRLNRLVSEKYGRPDWTFRR